MPAPVMVFRWANGMMQPVNPDRARDEFHEGELYRLDVHEEVSEASRGHYFAVLRTAWENLPSDLAARFPTVDHLRDHCLIEAGYCKDRKIVCKTTNAAAHIAVMARGLVQAIAGDVEDNVVLIFWPESQSAKAMGKTRFQDSKDAVFRVLSQMLGVDPTTLQANVDLQFGGADTLDNLQTLCRLHHTEKTSAAAPIRAKADRLRERHELTTKRKGIG